MSEITHSFLYRIRKIGVKRFILSVDTFGAIISGLIIGIITKGAISPDTASDILGNFILISASFFSIILASMAIFSSFSDKDYILAWKKIGEFENIITLFQYNLYLPIIILIISLVERYVCCTGWVMVVLISFFIYMILSLTLLIDFIARYALQRGEFLEMTCQSQQ